MKECLERVSRRIEIVKLKNVSRLDDPDSNVTGSDSSDTDSHSASDPALTSNERKSKPKPKKTRIIKKCVDASVSRDIEITEYTLHGEYGTGSTVASAVPQVYQFH
jgi:hypothetical protein